MIFKRTSDAATEPLTATEAKLHLRVDSSDEDLLIERLIKAARKYCENYTERSFITQTWTASADSFPSVIELLHGPVISITSVVYYNESNESTTLSTDDYTTDLTSIVARIEPVSSFPSTYDKINAVTVTYITGYGAASTVPEDIKAAMLLLIGKLYQNREETVKRLPTSVECLLDSYKVYHTI
jgi:uncharacterized phiE125 gp8 family phage protein